MLIGAGLVSVGFALMGAGFAVVRLGFAPIVRICADGCGLCAGWFGGSRIGKEGLSFPREQQTLGS